LRAKSRHTAGQRQRIFENSTEIVLRTGRIFAYVRPFNLKLVKPVMTMTAYLAGPDVFLPNAVAHAAAKVEICRRSGLRGLPPLNEDAGTPAAGLEAWEVIYEKDVAMMEKSDVIIANLTPFAGASADAGTLIEVGWFLGKGKPVFGYSNSPENFESRMRRQLGAAHADLGIEGFHLPDNLMIVGAVHSGGYPIFIPADGKLRGLDALDVFETCVGAAARYLGQAAAKA
jgi:nucleoside 2-deoxyribosyltransferase